MLTDNGVLEVWVIYENPADYPGRFVTRRQCVHRGGAIRIDPEPACVARTLDEAREAVPKNLTRFPPQPGDVPQIYETWF